LILLACLLITFWYLLQVNTNTVVMNVMIDATTKDLSVNASSSNKHLLI
jgi:hypothetical protein